MRLGGRHNMPTPHLDFWPFDLEVGVGVACDLGYPCAKFRLPRPFGFRVRADVQTDGRTTDADDRLMPPPPLQGGGITRNYKSFWIMYNASSSRIPFFIHHHYYSLHIWERCACCTSAITPNCVPFRWQANLWLTNQHPTVVWHCWSGHLTRKIIFKMTYNVSSVFCIEQGVVGAA